jgi:REP element-mobilizing transposase RayT
MSRHTFSRCWIHIVWGTYRRFPFFDDDSARRVSGFLMSYAKEKGIFMKTNFVNPEHVHALIDLPTDLSIEQVGKLLKGTSSHWINQNSITRDRFAWARGFGAFSVSHSKTPAVIAYIRNQKEHHRKKTFAEEVSALIERHGLRWIDDATVSEDFAEYGDAQTVETVW